MIVRYLFFLPAQQQQQQQYLLSVCCRAAPALENLSSVHTEKMQRTFTRFAAAAPRRTGASTESTASGNSAQDEYSAQ